MKHRKLHLNVIKNFFTCAGEWVLEQTVQRVSLPGEPSGHNLWHVLWVTLPEQGGWIRGSTVSPPTWPILGFYVTLLHRIPIPANMSRNIFFPWGSRCGFPSPVWQVRVISPSAALVYHQISLWRICNESQQWQDIKHKIIWTSIMNLTNFH